MGMILLGSNPSVPIKITFSSNQALLMTMTLSNFHFEEDSFTTRNKQFAESFVAAGFLWTEDRDNVRADNRGSDD